MMRKPNNLNLNNATSVTSAAIRKLMLITTLAFVGLAATLGYWQIVRTQELLQRDDNPRLVLAERAILRGTLFDRNGVPLALTQAEDETLVRYYPEPLAEPLVGYYSLRHGTAWAEASYDSRLRGSAGKSSTQLWWDELLHTPQVGQNITLTLDMNWQRAAYAAMGQHSGAIVVADVHNGQILAMVSLPTFDPNTLDADWEKLRADPAAPLLNRAVQSEYQPGSLFQTIALDQALRGNLIVLTDIITAPEATVTISQTTLGCAQTLTSLSGQATWADVYAAGCPGPFAELAQHLAVAELEENIKRWRLDQAVAIGLAGQETEQKQAQVKTSNPRDFILGQGSFTLTPLHTMHLLLTLANDGKTIPMSIVASGLDLSKLPHLISAEQAATLRNVWRQECGLKGMAGLAAGGTQSLAWYMGLGPAQAPNYAIVILIENAPDTKLVRNMACELAEQNR